MPDINLDDRESDFKIVTDTTEVVFTPNHQLMGRPNLREQDLRAQRIFFYENRMRDPFEILYFTEQEADLMMKSTWKGYLRQIGVSDGSAYREFIRNCGIKPRSLVDKGTATKLLQDALNAEIESARGHYAVPDPQNVHYDQSFPLKQRDSFVPPV